MRATHHHSDDIATFHVGTRVVSQRRGNAVGIVKTEPFRDPINSDRRWWMWVDYTDSCGVVAIDWARELHVVA